MQGAFRQTEDGLWGLDGKNAAGGSSSVPAGRVSILDGKAHQEENGACLRRLADPHFMIVPSLACPASCSYCFGPHEGPTMSKETVDATVAFVARVAAEARQQRIRLTFHGGEPLMAGTVVFRRFLDGLTTEVSRADLNVAVQSNLWLLNEEFCALFRQHRVEVSTSLDGPAEITDLQRGPGYFVRTMAGIRKAQAHGLQVGCIATFTPATLPRWREVFDFFIAERLDFSIHAAVPPLSGNIGQESCRPMNLQSGSARLYLSPPEYATLLQNMLDYYIENCRELTVSSLDQMCQGLGRGEGKVCTFRDCLGMFLAIDPNGNIHPCQRFCGRTQYRLGTLAEQPTLNELLASPVARRFEEREQAVRETCRTCIHFEYCKGGCPYNTWASSQIDRIQDPYCEAYRSVFDHIKQHLIDEMTSDSNIKAIAESPYTGNKHPLLRKGPLIELVRSGAHPSQIACTAKRIVAAVELAKGPNIPTVAVRLVDMGICRSQQTAEASLNNLRQGLHPETIRLNNLYLHVTFDCQLCCTHCYACASGHGSKSIQMSVAALEKLLQEAKTAGFRQVIITGGEPLIHPERDEMLRMLASTRRWAPPMNLVLRTNFAMSLENTDLQLISTAFDQVVVSVDGSEETHDARRGLGTYVATVQNLDAYVSAVHNLQLAVGSPGELSLACVMRAIEIQGNAGNAVRALADRLGIRRTRFRPLLPLGRAAKWEEPPVSEALEAHSDPMELIENGFHPIASCGFGQNLYVEPSGQSFPCYAHHQGHAILGNVIENGIAVILRSEHFQRLSRATVDSNLNCCNCEVRYLCGGACRAWGDSASQFKLDATPLECEGLQERAKNLLAAAYSYLRLE